MDTFAVDFDKIRVLEGIPEAYVIAAFNHRDQEDVTLQHLDDDLLQKFVPEYSKLEGAFECFAEETSKDKAPRRLPFTLVNAKCFMRKPVRMEVTTEQKSSGRGARMWDTLTEVQPVWRVHVDKVLVKRAVVKLLRDREAEKELQ